MTTFKHLSIPRQQRMIRIAVSLCCVLLMLFTMTAKTAFAASSTLDVQNVYRLSAFLSINKGIKSGDEITTASSFTKADSDAVTLATWTNINNLASAKIDADKPELQEAVTMQNLARNIVATFGNEGEYKSATSNFDSVFEYTPGTDSLSYKENKETKGKELQSEFAGKVSAAQAENTFQEIYDLNNWNPSAGVAASALAKVYNVVNTLFYVCAQLLMWFFIGQTALDVMYLAIEPLRPILEPKGGSGGGALAATNAGGDGGILSKIRLPLASHAAAEAANGGSGGIGGVNAGGNQNLFFSYALKRFPVLILCAVYIILVSNGYWIKVISWVSGFVVKILNFFLHLG